MNKIKFILSAIFAVLTFASCTKTESDFSETPAAPVENIKLTAPDNFIQIGTTLQFRVFSSLNNVNVTSFSKVFVNESVVTGDEYKF